MARIVGIDLPKNKRGEIGLTYIYGIGHTRAKQILDKAGVERGIKVDDWNDDQVAIGGAPLLENGDDSQTTFGIDTILTF